MSNTVRAKCLQCENLYFDFEGSRNCCSDRCIEFYYGHPYDNNKQHFSELEDRVIELENKIIESDKKVALLVMQLEIILGVKLLNK